MHTETMVLVIRALVFRAPLYLFGPPESPYRQGGYASLCPPSLTRHVTVMGAKKTGFPLCLQRFLKDTIGHVAPIHIFGIPLPCPRHAPDLATTSELCETPNPTATTHNLETDRPRSIASNEYESLARSFLRSLGRYSRF